MSDDISLGTYLRDRRERIDPAALGFSTTRRRTPGLRREEVAQRANISSTWYTCLEQDRGGRPSAHVLERIAHALMLTEAEREHVFILGLGHRPEVCYQPVNGITPRLQRVLDGMETSPAIITSATWDVVAWNHAAQAVLTDYAALSPQDRNVLRLMFLDPHVRNLQTDWQSVARFVVSVFRADAARAGAATSMLALANELCQASSEFAAMWAENDVSTFGEGVKRLRHPQVGDLTLEYSSFAVDGRPDLAMQVYTPVDAETAGRIRAVIHTGANDSRAVDKRLAVATAP